MGYGKAASTGLLLLAFLAATLGGCGDGSTSPQRQGVPGPARAIELADTRSVADAARNRLWQLTAEGVQVSDFTTVRRTTEVVIPDWQWAYPPFACLPGLALGPSGEAIVASNIVATLWRVDAETLAVSVHPLALDADTDKDVGFSSLVYSAADDAYFAVSDVYGSLWRIDRQLTRAEKIPLDQPIRGSCDVSPLALRAGARFALGQ